MEQATAAEIADYDQRKAQSGADLAELVEIWRTTNLDLPEYYRLVGFIQSLHENVESVALAEMLGLAISRLAAVDCTCQAH